jgi:hypothetical protein
MKVFRIDGPLAEFVHSGVATIVGTASDAGRPHVAYGWGPRVREGGRTLDVFLDAPKAGQALEDLRSNGRIAVTMGDPVSYRSVQVKGRFSGASPPSDADEVWLAAYREAFLVNTSLVGDPPSVIRSLWLNEVVRVSLTVEQAYDQTPGPGAGRPL